MNSWISPLAPVAGERVREKGRMLQDAQILRGGRVLPPHKLFVKTMQNQSIICKILAGLFANSCSVIA
jgi:hypothetical protein